MERGTVATANPNTLLSSLAEFCADSVSTCLSRDADKRCVPIALSSLSALFLLLSCFLTVYQRCRCRRETAGEMFLFLYSLLGNMCATVGATLSRQLHIQVLMSAVAAALDAAHFLSWCFPALLCWHSKAERSLRMRRRRRRQHLLAGCGLMAAAGGFLPLRLMQLPTDRPLNGRRLMHTELRPDNTEILGYTLGLLSFAIACTSRFPAICRAYRGHKLTQAHMISGLLCPLAGTLYAAAILLYDTLLRVMPWLMSAVCCVALDILILIIHWFRRGNSQQLIALSSDTESLLGCSGTEDKAVAKAQRNKKVYASTQMNAKNALKMTEMGRYLDVSVQPARKLCLKDVWSGEDLLQVGKVRAIGVGSLCSSDTSIDSSLSSELEWDFEEENAPWKKSRDSQHPPRQDWPRKPKLYSNATTGFLQKTLSGTQECDSFSSESLIK